MKQLNDLRKIENLSSYENKAIELFLNLEPMNKSSFNETMRHINHRVSNSCGVPKALLLEKDNKYKSYFDFSIAEGTVNSRNMNFLNEMWYGYSDSVLKQFKRENLTELEKRIYDIAKEHNEFKKLIKEHAEKLKAKIIIKGTEVKITPVQKVFPKGIAKDSLLEILLNQTKILKEEFLEATEKYAKVKFEKYKEISLYSNEQVAEKYSRNTRKGFEIRTKARDIISMGYEKFLQKELYMAELHYYSSIQKLTSRLTAKGIVNSEDFKIITAKVGVNIETIIKHADGKITKAWTIIASGEIQQPHFRYLIK